MIEIKLFLLLVVANGAPIVAKRLFRTHFTWPMDFGLKLPDGQALFGPTKTLRGIFFGVAAGATAASIMGWTWASGALFGLAAMAGDLTSSFIKRRLKRQPSSMALGIDQIPEALVPCLVLQAQWNLSWPTIAIVVVIFFVGSLVLSSILFKLHVRDRPY